MRPGEVCPRAARVPGLELMEGLAPPCTTVGWRPGWRRCQSHMRRDESQPEEETGPTKKTKVYVGMDVHKDSVMIAVLPEGVREPTLARRLSHDPRGIGRLLDRLAREHEVRACYEASGAGYNAEHSGPAGMLRRANAVGVLFADRSAGKARRRANSRAIRARSSTERSEGHWHCKPWITHCKA